MSREAEREQTGRTRSVFCQEVLSCEQFSVARGICTSGHFSAEAQLSDESSLRRAIDYFVASLAPESLSDAWAVNHALLTYLHAVSVVPFVLTLGWYQFAGRARCRHSPEEAVEAISTGNPPAPVIHIWLTSHAFEIVDVTMPSLLEPQSRRSQRNFGFYFRRPSASDLIVYHPTIVCAAPFAAMNTPMATAMRVIPGRSPPA